MTYPAITGLSSMIFQGHLTSLPYITALKWSSLYRHRVH